jgi:spermidine synthase
MILLAAIDSEFGRIEVLQRRQSGSFVYRQDGCFQSEADLDGVSLASYIHALYGLILQNDARNVLIIGCGGGTLATMLVKSGRDVTIVDIDPASFAVARKYFNLPATVACRISDGKYFLRKSSTHYDTIVIDAYQGGRVPAHLETSEFFDLAHKRLSESGSVFTNVHLLDDHDRRADQIAVRMGNTWNDVRILDSEGARDRNAVVMGGAVNQLQAPETTILPAVDAKLIEQELHSMKFRPCRMEE